MPQVPGSCDSSVVQALGSQDSPVMQALASRDSGKAEKLLDCASTEDRRLPVLEPSGSQL
jgi:hypothetical protein